MLNDNYINEKKIRHVQLDGLRAIAVFSVFMTHWLPVGNVLGFSPGRLGVNLFFVLSGFLITGILLKSKKSVLNGDQTLSSVVKNFFARRALRLLPLIYMVLFLTTVLNYPTVRETVAWHSLYVGNFYFALHGSWFGSTTHLWSLAVEEQFYMLWPLVILLVPNRFLLKTIIIVIISAPIFRFICYGLDVPSVSIRVLTPSSFDMFGVGALLALLSQIKSYEYVANTKLVKWMGIVGLPLLIIATASSGGRLPILYEVGQSLGSALFFGYIVIRTTAGFPGVLGAFLASKPMVYAGTISYGLYVVHNFMPYTFKLIIGSEAWAELYTLEKFGLNIIGTFVIASLSWHVFEKPINKYKKHFSYS